MVSGVSEWRAEGPSFKLLAAESNGHGSPLMTSTGYQVRNLEMFASSEPVSWQSGFLRSSWLLTTLFPFV